MLQRIQTVFLMVVAGAMGGMLFFPIWVKAPAESGQVHQIFALYYKTLDANAEGQAETMVYYPYIIMGILAVAAATVAVTEITKFNNRLLQIKLGALNAILMSATLGTAVYFTTTAQKAWMPTVAGEYQLGLFLPAIAMVCNVLANRFIRRDEKLVKSVDRIR